MPATCKWLGIVSVRDEYFVLTEDSSKRSQCELLARRPTNCLHSLLSQRTVLINVRLRSSCARAYTYIFAQIEGASIFRQVREQKKTGNTYRGTDDAVHYLQYN